MKTFANLAACCLLIVLTASTCEPCLETCDDFDIRVDSFDTTLVIDSVVYTSQDVMVYSNYQSVYYPTILFYVPINPAKSQSEMVIYTNKGDHTVKFKHRYYEYYDDECNDYVFRLEKAEASSTTIKVSGGYREFECMSFNVEL